MDKIYLSIYYFFKFLIFITPEFLLRQIVNFIAFLAYFIDKKHKKIILANLNLAYEDQISNEKKIEICKKCYKFFANFGIDFLKNQNLTKEEILNKINFENPQILQDALNSGRGVILQTAHFGNWELASIAIASKFGAISVIGRKLDSEAMDKIIIKSRTQIGVELIQKSNAAKNSLKALKQGRILGILTDQNTIKSEGVEVLFFGKKVLHTPAASVFAQKTGALIVPSFIFENTIKFFEPIDIKKFDKSDAILKATQLQSDATQQAILQIPQNYFWFHKRFKAFYGEIYE